MKVFSYKDSNFEEQIQALFDERSAFNEKIDTGVAAILKDIRERGDAAVVDYAAKYDGASLTPDHFRLSEEEIAAAEQSVAQETKDAIALAHTNVRAFSEQRVPQAWTFSPRDGVVLGEKFAPLDRVAAYIPGGTAPLVSTTIHTITMAQVAGVKEIVVLTPAGADGQVNPNIIYAAKVAGATEIYRLGGVYGIGAAAFGTETVRKVEKIVGPGNAYVTAAKRQVYGQVALDLVAGPSEILVIADETAYPKCIAADMLSQAEHGSGFEQVVFITTHEPLIEQVQDEIERQVALLPKAACIDKVLKEGTFLLVAENLRSAARLASRYAAEHLEIMTAEPETVAAEITAAGAIFLGPWTPEPVGDFTAGPSHVLPTGGAARFFSGLTVEHFFRRMSLVKYDKDALARERAAIEEFARVEQLAAHGRTAAVRFED